METFHLSFDEILWKMDWLNLILLMKDKLHYVGEGKGKQREATKDEELDFFSKLARK